MPAPRSIGVTFIASIFILLSGLTAFGVTIEAIDAMVASGFKALAVNNLHTFRGFVIFFVMPLTLYLTGIGLFYRDYWGWRLAVYAVPLFVFILVPSLKLIILYLLLVIPLVIYLRRPEIAAEFK